MNPDEGQFLASALKLFYDPNFFRAVDCHTSGPGNIFPLMAPAVFGLSPDFASGRIVALIAVFLSVFLLYRTVASVTREDLARISVLPVALAFPVFINRELVYYSSEHVPLLLVSLALFLSVRILVRPETYRAAAFLLGLTACTAFFTKMQSVPIMAAVTLVTLASLFATNARSRMWRAPLYLAAGALPPALLNTALCLKAGVWQDFWRSYIVANLEYTDTRVSLQESIPSFLWWTAEPLELRSFLFTVLVIAIAGLAQKIRMSLKDVVRMPVRIPAIVAANDPKLWLGLLALLSSGAAFFSVFAAQRQFIHYLLFLFIPLGMMVAWMLIHRTGRTILPHCTVAITLLSATYLWSFQDSSAFDAAPMIRAPEGDFIRTITSPRGQIYVWGWTALPYLASGRVPATRQTLVGTLFRGYNVMTSPPEFHPTPASKRVTAYYRDRELQDLRTNPPELFIDAIGPASWFLSSREYFGFERVPEIAVFVKTQYTHLIDLYQERYFLRRDLAMRREAEFNRSLPPKPCAPASVCCLDRPVTLPHELPPVQMPTRARIEADFMPIGAQIGTATVFNNEAEPNSFRGLRLHHVASGRYVLVVGLGDSWASSREFELPRDRIASLTIELDGNAITIENNGSMLEDMHLERPIAASSGPITIGSWIQGMAPFSGKIQSFQIVDLDR